MEVSWHFVGGGVLSRFLASRDERGRTSNAFRPLRYFWVLKRLRLIRFVLEVNAR